MGPWHDVRLATREANGRETRLQTATGGNDMPERLAMETPPRVYGFRSSTSQAILTISGRTSLSKSDWQ